MNIAVFASGRGSNFQAILDAIDAGRLSARITVLISNKADSGALEIARVRNIPTSHLSLQLFPSEDALAESMMNVLSKQRVDLIVLAGYLKKIPVLVVRRYRNRILNIHPALLPAFGGPGMYGHFVHEAVLASGVKISGATVHLVDEEYDRGPIVMQKAVEVSPDDTPDSLAKKVLNVEHEIFPFAVNAFVKGRIKIEGRKAWITS